MDIYGIIGYPIEHSLSPAMHNAALKHCGIGAEYRKFPVRPEELEDFLLNRQDVKGFNITIPHKVRAREMMLDRIIHRQSDKRYIEFCGAINTVKREREKFIVINSDVSGFMKSLKQDLHFEHKDKNILLIGCGGAGRAVIAGLAGGESCCNKIYVYDNNTRVIESAKKFFSGFPDLKNRLEFISKEEIPGSMKTSQLLVNASPIGMKEKDASPVAKGLLRRNLSVYDLVYNRDTQLIKDANSSGLSAVGGLGMLLYQGADAFELWTGKRAPVEVMKEALSRVLKKS